MVESDKISLEDEESMFPFWNIGPLLQAVLVPVVICMLVALATGVYFLLD